MKKNKKGFLSMQGWLGILIKLVIFVLIALAIGTLLKDFAEHMIEGMAVDSSARGLAKAINRVNRCIEDGSGDCTQGIEVRIAVPQNIPHKSNPSDGKDPLWVIYHNKCLSNDNDVGNTGCKGIPDDDPAFIIETDCECHSIWDSGKFAPRCENHLCWGLVENVGPGLADVEEEAMEKLKPFYILDPCYAVVKVREDPHDAGKIEICFKEELDGPGAYNWCFSKGGSCGPLPNDASWPDPGGSVWSDAVHHDHGAYRCL